MINLKNISIKNYMIILIAFFIVSTLLTNIFFLKSSKNVNITGKLYTSIIDSKNLNADILPPKLYIVESYLLIQQISNEKNDEQVYVLLKKVENFRQEYKTYYEFWKKNINNNEVYDWLVNDSHKYVLEFFKIYDEQFIPALKQNDHLKMHYIVLNDLNTVFEVHRSIIEKVSNILETTNITLENKAKNYTRNTEMIIAIIYFMSVILLIVISYFIFNKVSSIEKHIRDSKYETDMANAQLEKTIEGLKKFKHSVDNTLASIRGYANESDIEGLNSYLNDVILDKKQYEANNYAGLDLVKNPGLQGLILSKILHAQKYNIDFSLNVKDKIQNMKIKTNHLCEIIGILLDNAIEASNESCDKIIKFEISQSPESLIFEISNTFGISPDINRIFEKGWTTKGENRGFGLYIAKEKILNFDNVTLNTLKDESLIKQELIILTKQSLLIV